MDRRDVKSTSASSREASVLCASLFAAIGLFGTIGGLVGQLVDTRSELQHARNEKSTLQMKQRQHEKELRASRQRMEHSMQQHRVNYSVTIRAREKELYASRVRHEQLLHQIDLLNTSNATMATWNSVAQYQLRSYEASTQELSAALRAAQDEARTMKQSLRDAERQQAAEKQKYDRLRHVTSHLYSSLNALKQKGDGEASQPIAAAKPERSSLERHSAHAPATLAVEAPRFSIPRTVYQSTNYSPAVIPDLWGAAAGTFHFGLASNADIERYMHRHNITARMPDIFDSVSGIHKANLYQATVLYHNGGAYFDIKTVGMLPLDLIISQHHDRPTFYATFSRLHKHNTIHIGVMAATPRHPLMREWIGRLLKAGAEGKLSSVRPNLIVCHSLYQIFQKHFGLPAEYAGLNESVNAAGVYESKTGGRLILWDQRYVPREMCRWKHTGYARMSDRYGGCSLVYNASLSSKSAKPIMGVRDPTYPLSWAHREVNLSLGLALDWHPDARANSSSVKGRGTPGDGFFTMDSGEASKALKPLKDSLMENWKSWMGRSKG